MELFGILLKVLSNLIQLVSPLLDLCLLGVGDLLPSLYVLLLLAYVLHRSQVLVVLLSVDSLNLGTLLQKPVFANDVLHFVVRVLLVVGLALDVFPYLLLCHDELLALVVDALSLLAFLMLRRGGFLGCCFVVVPSDLFLVLLSTLPVILYLLFLLQGLRQSVCLLSLLVALLEVLVAKPTRCS